MDPLAGSRIVRRLSESNAHSVARLVLRADHQIAFARAFAESQERADWLEAVARAEEVWSRFEGEDLGTLREAVTRVEAEMAEVGAAAKGCTIHCVGHGHIDMNWMWSWPETVATTHDTFASVLSLMEQYPELTFSQSQGAVYALMERYFPDTFERIRERVREGRWEVAAAHWVEGDKNLASGESLARHLLYTRRYFQEKFGLSPEDVPVDWEPDTFGHANTIPTILTQGGVKYYYNCRPGGGQEHPRVGDPRPPMFWWQGPDGARVLVNRETTWYNSYVNIDTNFALPLVPFAKATGLTHWLNVYGVGNHGGGPTRAEIEFFLETREWPVWPTIEFSTSKRFFEAAEREIAERGLELPVIDHELNFEFTGCYTSQSAIKKANRFGENYCVEAEALSVLTREPNEEMLREAWLNVLFNQFHDILPGSGVQETRDHALGLFQEVGAITGAIKRRTLGNLVARIDTASLLPDTPEGREERQLLEEGAANTPFVAGAGQGAGISGLSTASGGGRRFRPYVVYNPCPWPRTEIVEVQLYDLDVDPASIVALDEEGVAHPTLVTYHGQNWATDWGHRKTTLLFVARDVPGMGYRTFLFAEGAPTADTPGVTAIDSLTYETPLLTVGFDRFLTGLKALTDRRTEADYVSGYEPLGHWEFVTERPRGMTSWVLGDVVDEPRPLVAKAYHAIGARYNQGTSLASGGSSVVAASWTLDVPGTESTVRLSARLQGVRPKIEFEAELDWREIGTPHRGIPGLRIDFECPEAIGKAGGRYETPFGTVVRTWNDDEEVPTLRFAHVGDDGPGGYAGVTITQDCKYGHSLDGSTLSMRVVRSSYDPDLTPEVRRSTMRYAIHLHDTPPTEAELVRLGMEQNHPLIVMAANLQEGDAPPRRAHLEVEEGDVIMSGLMPSEGGWVARFANYANEEREVACRVAPELAAGVTGVQRVDLLDRPTEGGASLEDGLLKLRLKARTVASVRTSR
jgi:alpha-mannosidase